MAYKATNYSALLSSRPLPVHQFIADSVPQAGTVTGPGAGAAIVTIAANLLPAGLYLVQVTTGYGGVAGLVNDLQLQVGAAVIAPLFMLPTANFWLSRIFLLTLSGVDQVSINAVAGSAGVYIAELVATMVRGSG